MTTHETKKPNPNVVIMWSDPKTRKEQTIKFNVKYGSKVIEGDRLSVGRVDDPVFYNILKIEEERDSTLTGWEYVTAKAIRVTK